MLRALTREVSPAMADCELTYRCREQISYELAARQHAEYCGLLSYCGAQVVKLPACAETPDCCFVEDTAIVLPEVAVIASMGAPSRRDETKIVAKELAKYRKVVRVELPAMIDGGDVVKIGKQIFVGISTRTNREGFDALARHLRPHGYALTPVRVRGSLHLTTACSALDCETLLVNPRWADAAAFEGFNVLHAPEDEPWAANTLRLGQIVCVEAAAPRTLELVSRVAGRVEVLDISEFRKAEGSLTCLSIVFEDEA